MFIFGEPVDVEKAQDWISSWIGPMDICRVDSTEAPGRGFDAKRYEGRDIQGWKETKEAKEGTSSRRSGKSPSRRKEREYDRSDAARRRIKKGDMDDGVKALRSPVPPRGNLVSKLLAISGQCAESHSLQSTGDLRTKLEKQRKQNENAQDVSKTSQGNSLARLSKTMDVQKKPEVKTGSPIRSGKSTGEDMVGRDDARRLSGVLRKDRSRSIGRLVLGNDARESRSRSTGRLVLGNNSRELRSKSTSRLKVEDRERPEKGRGRSASRETRKLQDSNSDSERHQRTTRSMSAARDLEGRRRDTIGGERITMKCWGSSWQQLEGRGEGRQQQFEEDKMGRMRSISTGRIPLKGGRSISSSRVGIGARRVRQI